MNGFRSLQPLRWFASDMSKGVKANISERGGHFNTLYDTVDFCFLVSVSLFSDK
jgi:hypothetical protein